MSDKAQQLEKLSGILRVMGGIFIIAGGVLAFDAAQVTSQMMGVTDPLMHKVIGGAVFVAGLVDFFVLPAFFRRQAEKMTKGPNEV